MRQCDLVVATGSQANVRAAYASGTPAFGVGAGNVAGIVDETADLERRRRLIVRSKTFDNATSCSSENSLVVVDAVYDRARACARSARRGPARRRAQGRAAAADVAGRQAVLGGDRAIRSGDRRARRSRRGATAAAWWRSAWRQDADGRGERRRRPSIRSRARSSSRCSPLYRVPDFAAAADHGRAHLRLQRRGPLGGPAQRGAERAFELGLHLPVSRVIVDQAHCIATGGSFDNGLPFSLSMGCGTWGSNNFSDNMNVRHYLNITRISRPIPRARADRGRDLRRLLREVRRHDRRRLRRRARYAQLIDRAAASRPTQPTPSPPKRDER